MAGRLRALHHVASLVHVLDVGEAEWTTAGLVPSEFGDCSPCIILATEFDYAAATRAPIGLVLDLSALNFADCAEEFNQVLIASAPW